MNRQILQIGDIGGEKRAITISLSFRFSRYASMADHFRWSLPIFLFFFFFLPYGFHRASRNSDSLVTRLLPCSFARDGIASSNVKIFQS